MSLGLSTPRWHRVFSTAGMALTNTATTGHALASVMHRLSASQAPGRTRRQFRFAGSSRSHAGKRCQLTRRQTTAEGQGRRRGKAVRRATDVTPAESTPRACPDGFGVNAIPTQEAREGALARFDALRKRLEPELAELLACPPHTRIKTAGVKHVAAPKKPGVYLFTEIGNHRYVGRSKNLNARFGQHVQESSGENSAPFAFNIARRCAHEAGFPAAARTRNDLATDPVVKAQFFAPAKEQVRRWTTAS